MLVAHSNSDCILAVWSNPLSPLLIVLTLMFLSHLRTETANRYRFSPSPTVMTTVRSPSPRLGHLYSLLISLDQLPS